MNAGESESKPSARHLFVMGCPRSGTTALWNLLVSHPRIVLGVERYGVLGLTPTSLGREHFEYSRFFEVESGDSFYEDLDGFSDYYHVARNRWHEASFVGDKIPLLFHRIDRIDNNFANSKKIMIVRDIYDVASSYLARLKNSEDSWKRGVPEAIEEWNGALSVVESRADDADFLVVHYEELFMRGLGIEKLFAHLDLDLHPEVLVRYAGLLERALQLADLRKSLLSSSQREFISLSADLGRFESLPRLP